MQYVVGSDEIYSINGLLYWLWLSCHRSTRIYLLKLTISFLLFVLLFFCSIVFTLFLDLMLECPFNFYFNRAPTCFQSKPATTMNWVLTFRLLVLRFRMSLHGTFENFPFLFRCVALDRPFGVLSFSFSPRLYGSLFGRGYAGYVYSRSRPDIEMACCTV